MPFWRAVFAEKDVSAVEPGDGLTSVFMERVPWSPANGLGWRAADTLPVRLPVLREGRLRWAEEVRHAKSSVRKDLRQYTRQGSNLQPSVP